AINRQSLSCGLVSGTKIPLLQVRLGPPEPARFLPCANEFWTDGQDDQPERESCNHGQNNQAAPNRGRAGTAGSGDLVFLSPGRMCHRISHRVLSMGLPPIQTRTAESGADAFSLGFF